MNGILNAVSYTHLDVYKRQSQRKDSILIDHKEWDDTASSREYTSEARQCGGTWDSPESDFDAPILGESGCGLCALYDLGQAGITHLKIVGRGNHPDRMVEDIRAMKDVYKRQGVDRAAGKIPITLRDGSLRKLLIKENAALYTEKPVFLELNPNTLGCGDEVRVMLSLYSRNEKIGEYERVMGQKR